MVFSDLATRPIGDAYSTYSSVGILRVREEVQKFTKLDSNISNVTIVGTDQTNYFNLLNSAVEVDSASASAFTTTVYKNSSGADTRIVVPYFDTNGQHQFAVAYSISTAELELSIKHEIETIVLFSLLGLLIAAGATYYLINRLFLIPLESVSLASQAISDGQYSDHIGDVRNDEIGDLARSVNQMATKLENDITKLKELDSMKNEFIMITSHNLRTPLTIIEGYMEMLRSSELPEKVSAMLDTIESGLKTLASFSEDILTIASIESGNTTLSSHNIEINEIFKGIYETYSSVAEQKQITFNWQVQDSQKVVLVSKTNIRGVVRNLLDNAFKFTKQSGRVSLEVQTINNDLIIKVSDTGIGIAPEEMPKLFTKFHRGTSTYKYDYQGTGIGLYATKLIVQAHKGKVTASSTLGKGSTFTVTLPNVVVNNNISSSPTT